MKKILISLVLAFGCTAGAPIVIPQAAPKASAASLYYEYSGGKVYVYLYEWPGIYVLVAVYPAYSD